MNLIICPKCGHPAEVYKHTNGCGWANAVKSDKPHNHYFCSNVRGCSHEWVKELK